MTAFAPGRDVVLELGEMRLPGRVAESGEGFVRVVAFVRPLVEAATLESEPVVVEGRAKRGIERVGGALTVEGSAADAVFRVDLDRAPQVVQRRDFVRVDAVLPARLWPADAEPLDTFALNVSGAGFLVAGPEWLRIGQEVRFELRLPKGGPAVEGMARVAREGDRGSRGLAFEVIANRDRELLVHFTFDRQRAQLRAGVEG